MSPTSPPLHPPLSPYCGSPRTPDRTRRATRVQKNVLRPKSLNPRRPTNMRFPTKSKSRKKSGLVRPVPKDSKGPGLNASISAPIPLVHSDGDEPTIGRNTIPAQQGPMSPEDINAKIQAMLAAHKQLKEDNAQKPSTPTSKASRIVSKVISVLSLSNRKDRDKENRATPGKSPAEQYLQRAGASDDIQRFKVQSVAGNTPMNIPRKPVPNSGSAILTPQTTACTYNAEALHKLTSAISEDERSSSSRYSLDPFSSETGFEDDLEYRTLRVTPDGSSTPCLGRDPRRTTDSRGSPLPRQQSQAYENQTGQKQSQIQIQDQARDQINENYENQNYQMQIYQIQVQNQDQGRDQNQDYQSQAYDSQSISAGTDLFMSDSSVEDDEESAVPNTSHGEVSRKKHPTPSAAWWEQVQKLRDAYQNVDDALRRVRPGRSLDELRYGPGGPHWPTPPVPNHLELPRPVRHSWRTFESLRPNDEGADEIDELS